MIPLPLRIAIVDDEAPARSRLRDLLADCAHTQPLDIVGEAASGVQALELLSQRPCDVVLLDVRMPGMDGIETAQHLRKLDHAPAVIFTTAYDAYALKAFEVHALDYLLKPIRAARLAESLALVRAAPASAPKAEALTALRRTPRTALSASERGKVHLIPLADILYLRAELKYVTARTREREFLLDESLARLEEEFGEKFVRVHRSCLVARAAIRGFERGAGEGGDGHWDALIKGCDERIAVSRRQQHIVRNIQNNQ